MANRETIAAIATPLGNAALGVIRVSGPASKQIARLLTEKELSPRHAHFCKFMDEQGRPIDQGMALFLKGPASFTGEDTLEVFAHGNRLLLSRLLDRIVALGARHARPGEFSERAFLCGKIDLLQAEAIADLIESKSIRAARGAINSLQGRFSNRINIIKDQLTTLRVDCESQLDFPEETETGDPTRLVASLDHCSREIATLLGQARTGRQAGAQLKLVMAGPPNVGKSSLMNFLTQSERSIVTPIPGTTRDLVSASIVLTDRHLELVDTAGIREGENAIEREGVKRAKEAIDKADLVLAMQAVNRSGDLESIQAGEARTITIINKIDLNGHPPGKAIDEAGNTRVFVSVKTGAGMTILMDVIKQALHSEGSEEDLLLARQRHVHALERVGDQLHQAGALARQGLGLELVAECLRLAQRQMDEITGASYTDALLGEIFSRFCIGK